MMMEEREQPPKEEQAKEKGVKGGNGEAQEDEEKTADDPLASVGDLFSFAQTRRVKLCLVGGFSFAIVTGCVFPGKVNVLCCKGSPPFFRAALLFFSYDTSRLILTFF